MPRRLRVVDSAETAAKPRKRLTVVEAAAQGSHRELLSALQGRVASAVQSPSCPAVALAALSRQLILISRELSAIDARAEDDDLGEAPADEAFSGDAV
jgi:hypothetical protein